MLVVLRFDHLSGAGEEREEPGGHGQSEAPAEPAAAVLTESAVPPEPARTALEVLSGCPGFVRGWLARGLDDPSAWVLACEWDGVGAYRRAMSSHHVRLTVGAFLAEARDEPSTFEPLLTAGPDGVRSAASDRADDADSVAPGQPPRSVR